jgi:hypothetical protein
MTQRCPICDRYDQAGALIFPWMGFSLFVQFQWVSVGGTQTDYVCELCYLWARATIKALGCTPAR